MAAFIGAEASAIIFEGQKRRHHWTGGRARRGFLLFMSGCRASKVTRNGTWLQTVSMNLTGKTTQAETAGKPLSQPTGRPMPTADGSILNQAPGVSATEEPWRGS